MPIAGGLRPTRDASCAPFVAAPPSPRVASAPAATVDATPGPSRAVSAPALWARDDDLLALVRLPANARAPWTLDEFAPRVPGIRPLSLVSDAFEPRRSAFAVAAPMAAALGLVGLVLGALSFAGGEGALPGIGSLPGPVLGAASFGGALGVVGCAVGALAGLLHAARRPRRPIYYVLRIRADARDALASAIARVGGDVIAIGLDP